ncbi:MAG: hypothetical protein LBD74_02885 [Spirochaetaceae bacterium]|jgi:hypothetical protein|nr:hypothetical protein [Spirochaetaceae bacterium]
MRKRIGGLGWILLGVFIGSCGFEVPEALTITGKPGIHLPLGSPFGAEGESINDFIGQQKMSEMISNPDGKAKLYDYQGDGTKPQVQTYLVRFKIAELNLDLKSHVKNADDITMPKLSIPAGPDLGSPVYLTEGVPASEPPSKPPFTISLGALEEWLKDIQLKGAGITITGGAGLENTLRLKIPQLGIANYSKGTPLGGDLVFTGGEYTLFKTTGTDTEKAESSKIAIYAEISGAVSLGEYPMELNFNWTEATLYPGGTGIYAGRYQMDFGSFTSYLGNAELKAMPTFMFIHGLPEGSQGKITLKRGSTFLVKDKDITQKPFPNNLTFQDETVSGPLPTAQTSSEQFDLKDLFGSDSSALDYTITVQKIKITPETGNPTITADLLAQIPLQFVITSQETITHEGKSYKELALQPLQNLSGSDTGGDLFGRSDSNEDDLLKGLGDVRLGFYNYTNTIVEGLSLFVGQIEDGKASAASEFVALKLGDQEPEALTFDEKDVVYPFQPQFKVLVAGDELGNSAFSIGPLSEDAKLDFSLVLDATATIEQTINF